MEVDGEKAGAAARVGIRAARNAAAARIRRRLHVRAEWVVHTAAARERVGLRSLRGAGTKGLGPPRLGGPSGHAACAPEMGPRTKPLVVLCRHPCARSPRAAAAQDPGLWWRPRLLLSDRQSAAARRRHGFSLQGS